ncbi:uncharacterized protein PV09_08299 [Verruconis gallopava]|uniref:CFEM domain-containing protein n=1 Tax=Verruconis gallopava TaxID=253628 RepID=A0A0D1YH28_9PEZI|nr:uncharacterized protein PV09_08299 [Verruconis gallopava]KIW00117.1 hypothetical protein PV09_08299 [Verruconis gallopava]
MKCSPLNLILLFTGFVSLVDAQNSTDIAALLQELQNNLPSCAFNCIVQEVPKSTCALTDFGCICNNVALNDAILACLQPTCTVVEQLQTQKFVKSTCGASVRNITHRTTSITWSFYSLAVLAVFLRLLGRMPWFGGEYSWDDYTIVLCLLALTPCCVIAQLMVNNGLGRDIWELTQHEINNVLFYFFIEEFLYTFLVVFTKISILLLYLRIFTSKQFKWQCGILITIVACFGISCIVSTGLYCRPIDYVWLGWDGQHKATCVDINAQTYSLAGINMTLDIIIFILPIPQLWGLQMHIKKKIAVASMFAVGIFVTACSIVRLGTILKWGKSVNPTYDYTNLAIWSLIEITTGVICACMPGMANLLRRAVPRVFGTTVKHSYPSSGDGSNNSYGKFSSGQTPQKIVSKTTVSVSYTGRNKVPDNNSTKSDELELTPPTAYKQHENYTRYSEETGNEDRKYGYTA